MSTSPKRDNPAPGTHVEIWRWEEVRYDAGRVLDAAHRDDALQAVRFANGTVARIDFANETWRTKRRRVERMDSEPALAADQGPTVASLQESLERLRLGGVPETETNRSNHQ